MLLLKSKDKTFTIESSNASHIGQVTCQEKYIDGSLTTANGGNMSTAVELSRAFALRILKDSYATTPGTLIIGLVRF